MKNTKSINSKRELQAVAEAMNDAYKASIGIDNLAQAAIAASDSKYVNGLVEALKFYSDIKKSMYDKGEVAKRALMELPEDLVR